MSGVKEASSRVEDLGSASRLHLSWKGISLPGESGAMDADVAITLKPGDPLSRWQFRVRNPSKTWGIEKVYLPILNLSPIADPADNVFIYPRHRGRLVEDPFHKELGFGDGVHNGGAYPGPFGMQFQALYNKRSGVGLFLGTQDPVPSIKTFEAPNYPTHITWRVAHFPANIGHPGEDYDLDYDCVVGPFTGDWWDACRIYREWAVKQTWCRKGRLSTRTDIPKWYKEAPIYLTINPGGDDPNAGALDGEIAPTAEEFMKFVKWAGMPLPGNWYGWKDYRTKLTAYDLPTNIWRFQGDWGKHRPCTNVHDGNYPRIPALPSFGRESKRLLLAGARVCPYITLQLYDQGPTENAPYVKEARPNIAVGRDGKPFVHSSEGTWTMCSWRPWWIDRVKETCVLLLKQEGSGGFYLDTMSGRSMACYGTDHGHTRAGGSSMTLGMHRLSEYVRDAVKALDPETITSGEDSSENMIDVIDGKLYQLNLVPVSTAPLYAAVYNDYIPRYGIRTHAWEEVFYMQAASLFVEGAQVGRIPIGSVKREDLGVLSMDDPAQKSMLDYLGQMVAYYRQDRAKKFLCYGQLMRPLSFRRPDPIPILSYTIREKWAQTGRVELPALQSGVFLAEDGELGVFVVNAGKDEIRYSSEFGPCPVLRAGGAGLGCAGRDPRGRG